MNFNPAIAKLKLPNRMQKLPIDERGYPVPKFVGWVDGKPDFRGVDHPFMMEAIRRRLCFLCGEPLGRHMAFVIGPMCCINRVSAEPPSHYECARFAVQACPFLTQPNRKRNEYDMPEDATPPGGLMIKRNPGVSVIWITDTYRRDPRGVLMIGDPSRLEFWARGRAATRDEIMTSIESGLPILRAEAERESSAAVAALEMQIARGLTLVLHRDK